MAQRFTEEWSGFLQCEKRRILSSDPPEPDEPDEPDNPTSYNAESTLPPSDPPEPDSASNSESGMQTPIPPSRLPALLPFLRAAVDAVSPPPSSPWQRGRRIHRALPSESESSLRRSSEPPRESPRVFVHDPEEHVTSDDIMWTPRREKANFNSARAVETDGDTSNFIAVCNKVGRAAFFRKYHTFCVEPSASRTSPISPYFFTK
ncbi:hypothetical protein B0H14DRAFT_2640513 [Mycena olivaceomarginata]|nr:hypothetical protein B0H14DRAFT_2640513 [Mycena olivaceomarginata]